MGDALPLIKHAFIGATFGSLTALAGDFLFSNITNMTLPRGPPGSVAEEYGRAGIAILLSTGSAAVALYAGDMLMAQMGGGDDPLQGIFFYYTAFSAMQTTSTTPRLIRMMIQRAVAPSKPAPPAVAPGTSQDANQDDMYSLKTGMKRGCTNPSGCGALIL